MNRLINRCVVPVLLGACVSALGHANPIEGGTTEFVSDQWNVPLPWLMVGSNSSSNMLYVSNGGLVNSQIGIIGNNAGSKENTVFVSGSNAVWHSAMEIAVGNLGSDNALALFGGGQADTANLHIGKSSSNNFALVSGHGSTLNASALNVGYTGADNALMVGSGGLVESGNASMGYWIGSAGNSALVMGSNAVWKNSGRLNVGEHGADNLLMVVDGGALQSPVINVGVQSYSSNNIVSVRGADALLTSSELTIGGTATAAGGSGNRVSVGNGGTVATTDLTIHSGNSLDLNDGGTFAINNDFNASMGGFNWNDGGQLRLTGALSGMPTQGYLLDDYEMLDGEGRSLVLDGGTWSNGTPNIAVGWNGSDNTVVVTNQGQIGSFYGRIGFNEGSDDNTVVLTGSGSVWTNERFFKVGERGAGNELLIEAGADVVNNGFGSIGDYWNASNNSVVVSGANSTWQNRHDLYVGNQGTGNTLTIAEGGSVDNASGTIGASGGGNSVHVIGKDSVWSNRGNLDIGQMSSGNTLEIASAGRVSSVYGRIGSGSGASGNGTRVDGAGSEWIVGHGLAVGYSGTSNRLEIINGGVVSCESGHIGQRDSAANNSVLVSGKGSLFECSSTLNMGGEFLHGTWRDSGSNNTLVVEDAAKVLVGNVDESQVLPYIGNESAIAVGDSAGNGAMVVANGSFVNTGYGIIGSATDERGSVVVTGSGTVWSNRDDMYVGYAGSGSELTISDGGRVENGYGLVGWVSGSDSNKVTVAGSGSVWQSTKELRIGGDGAGNRLDVVDGGLVMSAGGVVGRSRGGDGNVASVSGTGSVWNAGSGMSVGAYGDNNLLEIKEGGLVVNAIGRIGDGDGTGNLARITGDGSVWRNLSTLFVGSEGDESRMEILAGGRVENVAGRIGQYGANNFVLVSDAGSVWNNSGSLHVGEITGGNSLVVSNAGQVVSGSGSLGAVLNSHNNNVTVTGAGSEWIDRGGLTVGAAGRNNSMDILDGGLVVCANGAIGDSSLTSGNRVTVSGSGSMWSNTANLTVGTTSGNNRLEIAAGGQVYSETGTVGGNGFSANGNQVDVSGAGSLWESGGQLTIGNKSDYNALNITAGGRVEDQVGILGYDRNSSGNSAAVSGAGSVWQNRNELHVGYAGSDNSVLVTNGAALYSQSGSIGEMERARGNSVVVTGAGSVWKNDGGIWVGYAGNENALDIADGASVHASSVVVGSGASASNNTLTVSGAQLVVDADFPMTSPAWLIVGGEGSGNAMRISDGGTVVSKYGMIGNSASASNNLVSVSGNDSSWHVADNLLLDGVHNRLEITDGGAVQCVGTSFGQTFSHGNSILVSGAGSVLGIDTRLHAIRGAGHSLTVEDGGWVLVGEVDANELPTLGSSGGIAVGDDAEMVLGSGSTVDSGYTYIGAGTNGNAEVVVQEGSVWNNQNSFYLGTEGGSNSLIISRESYVGNTVGVVGLNASSEGNSALVSGYGATWQNREGLYLGGLKNGTNWIEGGAGNSVVVETAGRVLVGNTRPGSVPYLGTESGVVVSGTDVAELVVGNGSTLQAENTLIGVADAENGYVLVTGAGSVLTNYGSLHVGYSGTGNRLEIKDGGQVDSAHATIGYQTESIGNIAVVSGPGSVWNSGSIAVGMYSSNNLLVVTDGGQVHSAGGTIGSAIKASSNLVQVAGQGSAWLNESSVIIGNYGVGNVLEVSEGGRLTSAQGILGNDGIGKNNSVVVMGTNSVWNNQENLLVGRRGKSNQLKVLDGGTVDTLNAHIGFYLNADNNGVVVAGQSSTLRVKEQLTLGVFRSGDYWLDSGTGNSLTVSNSGWVLVGDVDTNNVPTLGSGGVLVVGDASGNPEMIIANGSSVDNAHGFVGLGAGESGRVDVYGENSLWNNSSYLHVGYESSGNTLEVTDGARVHAGWNSTIGYADGADGNRVVVSGEDSVLSTGWGVPIARPITIPPISIWPLPTNQIPIIGYPPIDFPPYITPFPTNPWPPYIVYTMPTNFVPINPGSGSVWNSGGNLIVGSVSNNVLILTNGASFVGGEGLQISSGNQLVVHNGGFVGGNGGLILNATNGLTLGSATAIGGFGLVIGTSNAVITAGTFTGGAIGGEPVVVTNYPLPMYPVVAIRVEASMGELTVGRGGSDNTLDILDGATVSSFQGIIGETSNAWNNAALVVGTNSAWNVSRDFYLGGRMSPYSYMTSDGWENEWVNGGQGNSLYVGNGGLVTVGQNMANRNHSEVTVESAGQIEVGGNYYQDASSVLRFGLSTNATGVPVNGLVRVVGTAEFEAGATLELASQVGALAFDTFYTNKLIEADKLIVAGIENPDALDLELLNASGSLVDVLFWENDADIYGLVGRRYLADSAGFVEGSMMAMLSKEIDDLSLLGDPAASTMINALNGMSGSQQHSQLSQLYVRGTPSYLHAEGMTEGMAENRKRLTRHTSSIPAPAGVAGPYEGEQGIQGWVKPYGAWAEHSAQGGFSGYDHSVYGTLVGFDLPLETALLGLAGGYGRSVVSQYDGDHSEAKTGYGVLYLDWGTEAWFGQANMAYGQSKVEQRSGTVFGTDADFDADNFAVYAGGGKTIWFGKSGFLLEPKGSLLWSYYNQDAHTEQSMAGVAREVEPYSRDSVLSSLGATLAYQKEYETAIVKPEIRCFWLHEFCDDADAVGYQLANGTGEYYYLMPAPEADVLEAGAGLSCRFHDELELGLDVDWRVAPDYTAYSVGGRVVLEF